MKIFFWEKSEGGEEGLGRGGRRGRDGIDPGGRPGIRSKERKKRGFWLGS
jgi:hypothetical protein